MSNIGINVRWADNTAQLRKNLEEGLDQIEVTRAAVDKMAQSLGGDKLLRGANNLVAALQKIGGESGAIGAIERQTNAERERTINTLQKAIDKYTSLGRVAPSAMKELLAAAQAAQRPTQALADQAANVQRQFERFSGDRVIANAHAIATAVAQIGGASRLTAADQDVVNREVSQALEYYKALGQAAPANLLAIEAATKKVATEGADNIKELAKASTHVEKNGEGLLSWLGKTNGLLATLGVGVSVAGFVGLGKSILETTGRIQDLHEATGVSRTGLQQLGYIGAEISVTMDEIGRSVGTLSDRLSSGDQSAVAAVEGLRLSVRDLIAAGPEEAFLQITEAAGRIQDPMQKAEIASDLFGDKLGRKLIPLLGDLRQKMEEVPKDALFTDQDIEDADKFGDALSHIATILEARVVRAMRWLHEHPLNPGPTIQQQIDALPADQKMNLVGVDRFNQDVAARAKDVVLSPEALSRADILANRLNALRQSAIEPLTKAQQEQIVELDKFGQSQKTIAELVGASDVAVGRFLSTLKKTTDETARHKKALDDMVSSLKGLSSLEAISDLREAWNRLTPAERSNEQTVQRLLDAYEPLRAQLDRAALPADLEALRTETERIDGVMRSRAIPAFVAVSMNLEQMRNLSKGFTSDGLIPMNAAFTDAGRSAAALDAYLKRLKVTRDTLANAVANQSVPMPTGTPGIAGADRSIANPITSGFEQAMEDIPGIIAQGFAAGGKIQDALRAAASKIGAEVGKGIGEAIGGEDSWQAKVLSDVGALAEKIGERLYDALTTSPGEDVMHRIGRTWGIQITEAMGDQIAKDAKDLFHGSRLAAEVFNIREILQSDQNNLGITPRNFDLAASKIRDVFALIAQGEMTVAQGAKVIDENWDDLVAAGTDSFGFISDKLREIIALDAQYGTQSKQIAAFLKAQADTAVKGSNAAIGALSKQIQSWVELKKKIDEARVAGRNFDDLLSQQRRLAADNRDTLEDLGTIALATFSAAVASGKSFAEALEAAQPGLSQLAQGFDALGISTDNAALKALLLQSTILDRNPALLQAVSGLGQSLVALSNMGLLNVDTFSAMERTGLQAYARLQGEVAAVGGTTKDALLPMQDYLHKAQKAAEELGIPLDENTQMLIDQSKELGVWKEAGKSATDKLIGGMETLIQKVEKLINTLLGIPDVDYTVTENRRVNTDPSAPPIVPNKYNDDGSLDLDGDPATPFGVGGSVGARVLPFAKFKPIGMDVVPAMLRTDEMVLTAEHQQLIGSLLASGGATGSFGSGDVVGELQQIRQAILAGRQVSVQIDGVEVVRASQRALDNSGQLLSDHKQILGVA